MVSEVFGGPREDWMTDAEMLLQIRSVMGSRGFSNPEIQENLELGRRLDAGLSGLPDTNF